MTLEERIAKHAEDCQEMQRHIEVIDKNISMLQARKEQMLIAFYRADGALGALKQMQSEGES